MRKMFSLEKKVLFFLIFYILLFFFTCSNGFFWDTIHLASLQAWWYYDNNFSFFFLPDHIDSGHPSYFAILLAFIWKIFKPSLVVSHLMMLPFVILLIVEVVKTSKFYFRKNWVFASSLVLFNPIVLAQSTLVSPDVVLFCFFFFTFNGIISNRTGKILIGTIVLGAISMRGMMCIPYLFIFAVIKYKSFGKQILAFIPGALLAFLFLLMHYWQKGWIGYHVNSPWAASFQRVGFDGFSRNTIVFLWRLFDLGMVFMWLTGLITLVKANFKLSSRTKELLVLACLCFACSVLIQFFYKYSLLHRYLLPFIAVATFVVVSVLEEALTIPTFKKCIAVSLVFLISGNFWIYPDKIAKSWDATLSHLFYYKYRTAALDYLKENGLSLNRVSGGFPYYETGKCIDLTNDTTSYFPAKMEKSEYILYSNISNDYSDTELEFLKDECETIKTFGQWPVRFVLYKNSRESIK